VKTVFKIIAGLIVVIVIAIAAVLITFNPNDYKKQITDAVEQQTGRTLTINGDISVSVFPWIGFEVGKVSLSNASGFSAADFARISRLDIKIKLLPLLRREVDIDKVRLHGLFVSLETHKDGKTNWQDLIPESADVDKQATPVDAAAAGEPSTGPALAGLLINGVDLVGANIQWIDDSSGMQAKISDLNLETGAIKFDDWVPLSFSAHVNNSQPEADASVKLDTRIRVNQALDVFDVKNFTLDVNALMKSIASDRIAATIKMNADVDMRKQTVNLSSLDVSALGASLKAALTITDLDTKPLIKGTVSSNTIKPRELANKLGIQLPPSRDSWALSELSFNSDLEAGTTFAKLDKLTVKLDKSTLSGFVHVNNLAQPNISYQLALDAIDVDAYLPAPVASPAPVAPEAAAPPADVAIPLPLEFLRKLALDGQFSIASLQVSKIAISDMLIKTHAADGVIKVDPLSMKLLDGSFNAGLTLDARSTPGYQINAKATDIKPAGVVNPLLKGLLGNQKLSLEGVAQFNADIKTHGETLNTLKQAATGTVSINMGHTSVTGVDINYYLRDGIAKFAENKKLSVPENFRGIYTPEQKTAFDKVLVHAKLAGGKVHNDQLLLDSRRLKVNGSGMINIMNNTLDEKVFVQLDVGENKTVLEKILQKPVGVRVHGAFAQPAIDIDYDSLTKAITGMLKQEAKAKAQEKADAFKAEQKAKLEAQKQKLKEQEAAKKAELEQKAKDKLKDKLKGLFGQ
jgi:AsmA protein